MRENLNKHWELCYRPLGWGVDEATLVVFNDSASFEVSLPCDVHEPLIENGIIAEPLEELNSFDCEWVEEKSWWFRREVTLDEDALAADRIELTFESIDLEAELFVNGTHLAHHANAHVPLACDITGVAKRGSNTVLVRVSSGAEKIPRELVYDLGKSVSKTYGRGDDRRVYLRKPQYVYGWDWGPRLVTCGIVKDVYLEIHTGIVCRDAMLVTQSADAEAATADVVATVTVENLHIYRTREASVQAEFLFDGEVVACESGDVQLRSGLNFVELSFHLEQAHLWWPRGMGDQPLYEVRTTVTSEGDTASGTAVEYGIRTLRLDESPMDNGRLFAFEVNGKRVFCRGGDWIPADSIYSRVSDEKYTALVDAAAEANFTMLRIWGGGIYERDIFYSLCDKAGILIWHDFMYACALYPEKDSAFVEESRKELDYQTRRLRNHSSIAVFCGSNENHWIYQHNWSQSYDPEYFGGGLIYNYLAPQVMASNCPHIPYWNSSPYGGEVPNSTEVGNRHHWHEAMMNPEMEKRITPEGYDRIGSRFVTEYGYIGPCSTRTIERYYGATSPIERGSDVWEWHNNTFEKDTVVAGIKKHYMDPDNLSLEDYLLYAGLCQSLMLGYSLEALRYTKVTNGALFWMYADCWGEVGWTIVDYYLDRKPAYYAVKRAFAPQRLILRREGSALGVMLTNDTPLDCRIPVQVGFVSFDGSSRDLQTVVLSADAFSRSWVELDCSLDRGTGPDAEGLIVAIPETDAILPGILRATEFRNLRLRLPSLDLTVGETDDDTARVTVSSDSYAHAVHLELPDGALPEDDYFDLLPGERRTITIRGIRRSDVDRVRAGAVSV